MARKDLRTRQPRSGLSRRQFLSVAGAAAAGAMLPRWARGQTPAPSGGPASRPLTGPVKGRPNIVLIMADDMGFSDIGCYGSEIATPNLDRLAAGGLRFSQFYNAARCCPTRASLLTGLYPHQAGMGHMDSRCEIPAYQGYLNDRCVTIGEALRGAGYQTFLSGKWHVGGRPGLLPRDRGFDRFYGLPFGASGYFGPDLKDPFLRLDDEKVRRDENWYATDAYTDWAVKFLDQAATKKDAPFFLYLAYTAPHWPLQAKDEDIARYRGKYKIGWDEVRARRHQRQIEMGIVDANWPLVPRPENAEPWAELSPEQQDAFDLKMAVYAAQIDCMDQGIGRVLDKLAAMGVQQNTLVLFLSDNGGCAEQINRRNLPGPIGTKDSFASYGLPWANASNTPFRFYKHFVHEGGIATPLIAYWPAVIQNGAGVSHEIGHIIDLMATCCDAAGAEYPRTFKGHPVTPLEGKSLVPVFRTGRRDGHAAIFWEHEGNLAVRQGNWKLVQRYKNPLELFDMAVDRTELNDLAQANPAKLKELTDLYDAWADRCGVQPWKQINAVVTGKAKPAPKPTTTAPATQPAQP